MLSYHSISVMLMSQTARRGS